MPFVSKAQRAWMYANKPEMAKEWEQNTPANLPERVKKNLQGVKRPVRK